jgi:HEAT repeat protein
LILRHAVLVFLSGSPVQEAGEPARGLIERLASEDVQERDDAANRLKSLGPAARPELEKAAGHPDPEVAARARLLLRRLDILTIIPRSLRDFMPGVEDRLMEGGFHEWTHLFLEISKPSGAHEGGDGLRKKALEEAAEPAFLGANGRKETLEVCTQALRWDLRPSSPGMVRALIGLVRQEDGAIGPVALRILEKNPREAAPALVRLLPPGPGRDDLRQALERCYREEHSSEIIKLLKDPGGAVRANAAWCLAHFGAKGAVPSIRELLLDDEARVRAQGARALGSLGAKEEAARIAALLKDGDINVRGSAGWALGELGTREFTPEIRALLQDPDGALREIAAEALGKMGAREAIRELVGLLDDPALSLRLTSLRALGALEAREAAPEVLKRFRDAHPDIREAGARAFGSLGAEGGRAELIHLLRDPQASVRMAAIAVLRKLKTAEALPEIRALMGDRDAEVRSVARDALESWDR